jgi:AcrR family transcriptional regulator
MTAEKVAEASRLLGTVPLTQIAREIGVSRGTLYTHLPAIKAIKITVGG